MEDGEMALRRIVLLFVVICLTGSVYAKKNNRLHKKVDWRLGDGSVIKAINYPEHKRPLFRSENKRGRAKKIRKKTLPLTASSRRRSVGPLAQSSTEPIIATVIDSPPIDGPVPWIAVAITDEWSGESEGAEPAAVPTTGVIGDYQASNPERDYAIGMKLN